MGVPSDRPSEGSRMSLPADVLKKVRQILDREARRLLDEELEARQ